MFRAQNTCALTQKRDIMPVIRRDAVLSETQMLDFIGESAMCAYFIIVKVLK